MATPFDSDRAWPVPDRLWDFTMCWHDLLFLHWPIDASVLRPLVPSGLELETFDGSAWIGVVPFRMSNVRPRGVPELPWLSRFCELNVRTYVTRGGRPGVWFFSLDAASRLAVRLARARFHLPYFDARMRCVASGGAVDYESARCHAGAPAAGFRASWRPAGPLHHARAGTLEHFLTARFCLYSQAPDGRLLRGEIDHPRWPLRVAQASVESETMVRSLGLPTPDGPPLAHCVERLDVVGWTLEPA